MKIHLLNGYRIDIYLLLVSILILVVFNYPSLAFAPAIMVLGLSYIRILIKGDVTAVVILMLISRLIMGPFMPGNTFSFNILNILCNYLPFVIVIAKVYAQKPALSKKKLLSFKWTIVFVVFLCTISLFNLKYSLPVFPQEILPLIVLILFVTTRQDQNIDFEYLVIFFRYTFIACLIAYLNPNFGEQMQGLFANPIIFKEANPDISLFIRRTIPRNTGFVFDFRIMGQLACIYLLLLYYLGKKLQFFDLGLLIITAITTFSRGPLIILALIIFAVYFPKKIRLTKKRIVFIMISAIFSISAFGYIVYSNNEVIDNYIKTYNPFSKNNAISQRGMFIQHSLDKFYEKPLGNGLGSLSAPSADNKIFAGYTNRHKEVPDKVYYYRVTDAFLAMTLAEIGIIGFLLFFLSLFEIFFSNKNRVSQFFLLGLLINLIGTDIPKQGFYYFAIIFVYYGISQRQKEIKTATILVKDLKR